MTSMFQMPGDSLCWLTGLEIQYGKTFLSTKFNFFVDLCPYLLARFNIYTKQELCLGISVSNFFLSMVNFSSSSFSHVLVCCKE